ncbi:hypothetical protein A2311_01470 [candidate division WOR-1 bacterium RIFOXYB2_FULL_48_7]|uniref:Uncharacterized protein n=1 Tax=candidate division WOR-1 bacterium RIFOXYB2_FULL_48_7 TaxID=1802583 RepID=A0A1F4TP51_UNCSA|nr:MAG: hypothetical protein A2311_01470 [candidate division WOR-1 bacterium RIFOXYB2_FULL_48_7]
MVVRIFQEHPLPAAMTSRKVGRMAARQLALGAERRPVTSLFEVREYYRRCFAGRIPGPLAEQISWATKRHPALFQLLVEHDVLPLDVLKEGAGLITVVEYLRDDCKIDSCPLDKLEKWLPGQVKYLLEDPFGALYRRGLPYYLKLFQERPELLPIARPSTIKQHIMLGRELKTDAGDALKVREPAMRQSLRLQRPGVICDSRFRNLKRSTADQMTFHRQCWAYFHEVGAAVDYLLAGGEMCWALRENPNESLYALVRRLNYQTDFFSDEGYQTYLSWAGENWSTSDRPFISVTTQPGILPVIKVRGNLFIEVRSTRAFPVVGNYQSLAENEWLVPFVINPAEITGFSLRLPGQTVNFPFVWNHDFTSLEVAGLRYDYDPIKRAYARGTA